MRWRWACTGHQRLPALLIRSDHVGHHRFDVLAYLASAGAGQFAETVRPHIPGEKNRLSDGSYSVVAAHD